MNGSSSCKFHEALVYPCLQILTACVFKISIKQLFDGQNAMVNTMNTCSKDIRVGSMTHNVYFAKVQQWSHR